MSRSGCGRAGTPVRGVDRRDDDRPRDGRLRDDTLEDTQEDALEGALEGGWLAGEGDPDLDMEPGLPLGAENFTTGEPLVTVDYFDLTPGPQAGVVERLLALVGAEQDHGAECARVLLFESAAAAAAGDLRAIIAILTVRDDGLRVETARSAVSGRIRTVVELMLGRDAVHRLRRRENPFLHDLPR